MLPKTESGKNIYAPFVKGFSCAGHMIIVSLEKLKHPPLTTTHKTV